jgi:hypothetical protein
MQHSTTKALPGGASKALRMAAQCRSMELPRVAAAPRMIMMGPKKESMASSNIKVLTNTGARK